MASSRPAEYFIRCITLCAARESTLCYLLGARKGLGMTHKYTRSDMSRSRIRYTTLNQTETSAAFIFRRHWLLHTLRASFSVLDFHFIFIHCLQSITRLLVRLPHDSPSTMFHSCPEQIPHFVMKIQYHPGVHIRPPSLACCIDCVFRPPSDRVHRALYCNRMLKRKLTMEKQKKKKTQTKGRSCRSVRIQQLSTRFFPLFGCSLIAITRHRRSANRGAGAAKPFALGMRHVNTIQVGAFWLSPPEQDMSWQRCAECGNESREN